MYENQEEGGNLKDTIVLEKVADLLDYPGPDLAQRVKDAICLLDPRHDEASALLEGFGKFVRNNPVSRLEEIYTSTFDLQPVCCLYVGHHLFGESHRRGLFMAGLKEHYQARGFSSGHELPDHLGAVLRFISKYEAEEREMVQECVLPALKKMLENFKKGFNPYADVLKFFLLYFEQKLAFSSSLADSCH